MSDVSAPPPTLNDLAFDQALIAAAFRQAAAVGWRNVQIAAAAREAGLSLVRARHRFPSRAALLVRFGRMADAAALAEPADEESVRGRLFGMLMRRFDVLQAHRAGVVALLGSLPSRPQTALFLTLLTETSMRWMLDAAGTPTSGLTGRLRIRGLVAVWLWAVRAWERDETADLGPTMAVLDAALARAERAAGWLASLPGAGSATSSRPGEAGSPQEGSSEKGSSEGGPDGEPAEGRSHLSDEPPKDDPQG